jgi:hypothetical protein
VLASLRNSALGGVGQQALGCDPDPGGNPVAGDGSPYLGRHAGGRDDSGCSLHQHHHVSVAVSFGDRHGQPGLGTYVAFAHSVAVADPATGTDRLAVVLIPADSAGIQRAPFWQTTALAGAESDHSTRGSRPNEPSSAWSCRSTAVLGGMSFIESPEIAYLLGATRALAFHPPSRAAAAGPIARYLVGGPLTL